MAAVGRASVCPVQPLGLGDLALGGVELERTHLARTILSAPGQRRRRGTLVGRRQARQGERADGGYLAATSPVSKQRQRRAPKGEPPQRPLGRALEGRPARMVDARPAVDLGRWPALARRQCTLAPCPSFSAVGGSGRSTRLASHDPCGAAFAAVQAGATTAGLAGAQGAGGEAASAMDGNGYGWGNWRCACQLARQRACARLGAFGARPPQSRPPKHHGPPWRAWAQRRL